MKLALVAALVFTAAGSVLGQNQTADAGNNSTDVSTGKGHRGGGEGEHKGHGGGNKNHHPGHGKHGKHGKGKANRGSTLERCNLLQHMTGIIDTANNETLLQKASHGNATKAAEIQQHAARLQNATDPEAQHLNALKSNATLLATCDQIFAIESSDAACQQMFALEGQAAAAANQTKLAELSRNNATRAQQLMSQVTANQPKLAALQQNATLLQFCAGLQTRATCRQIQFLRANVDLARNASLLNHTMGGNATAIAAFQQQATKEAAKLDQLLNNATLVAVCNTQGPSVIETANETDTQNTTTQSQTTSAALSAHATAGSTMVLAVLFMCGFALL